MAQRESAFAHPFAVEFKRRTKRRSAKADKSGLASAARGRFWPEAAIGQSPHMSAFEGEADMVYCSANVRL
jgi:hypothetical protein